jgi:hypothetical protein
MDLWRLDARGMVEFQRTRSIFLDYFRSARLIVIPSAAAALSAREPLFYLPLNPHPNRRN